MTRCLLHLLARKIAELQPMVSGWRRSPPYDPTTTLTFRVAGLDRRTLQTTILGYAQLPAFRNRKEVEDAAAAKQPASGMATPVWLNEGMFQLPIYRGMPSAKAPFTASSCHRFPTVPCATLLVRLENLSDEEEEGAGVEAKGDAVIYHITVWTGKQVEAGTDAPVKISLVRVLRLLSRCVFYLEIRLSCVQLHVHGLQLRCDQFGPLGGTGPHVLEDDDPATTDEFNDGSVDVFELAAPDVGTLRHIRIGHDSTDGWFLRKVKIERKDKAGKGVWHFPCYRWLDPDKDDLCPYRTITPSVPDDFKVGNATQLKEQEKLIEAHKVASEKKALKEAQDVVEAEKA
eukprot:COSAG02_NODE_7158_length_3149_cov_9458.639672_1_plen_343_part_10